MRTKNQIYNTSRNIAIDLNLVPECQKNNLHYFLEDFCFETSSDASIISKSENDQKVAKNNYWNSYITNPVDPLVNFFPDTNEKIYLQRLPTRSPEWLTQESFVDDNLNSKKYGFDNVKIQTGIDNEKCNFEIEEKNKTKIDFSVKLTENASFNFDAIETKQANQETTSIMDLCPIEKPNFCMRKILSNDSFSDNLVDVLIKTLSNRKINESDISMLTQAERLVLFIYLNKRCIIPNSALDQMQKYINNAAVMVSILDERSRISNCNESGLTETIINRVIRFCFENWIKTKKMHVFNGKYKLGNQKVSNEEINKKFWQEMITGKNTGSDQVKNFEKMILKINRSIQIKKKKLKKKKKQKNISIKKPKYLNIFFKKKLKHNILKCVKKSPGFRAYLKAYKKEVIGQYKPALTLAENEPSAESGDVNCKFTFQLKLNVKKAIGQIFKWFSKNGPNSKPLLAEELKVKLKHIACPVTMQDYLNIFKMIEDSF